MGKKMKRDCVVIGMMGSSVSEFSNYLRMLADVTARRYPESKTSEMYVDYGADGKLALFYDRYMTDVELENRDACLENIRQEVIEHEKSEL